MANAGPRSLRCPFCRSAVLPSQDGIVCSACGIPHHCECWRLNGRCTTYGCIGHPVPVPPEPDVRSLQTDLGLELPPIELTREQVLTPTPPWPPGQRIHGGQGDGSGERVPVAADGTPTNWRSTVAAVAFWAALLVVAALAVARPRTPEPPWSPSRPPTPSRASKAPPASPRRLPAARVRASDARRRVVKRLCYVRSFPDEHAPRLAELWPGDFIEVLSINGPWVHAHVRRGQDGYVTRSALATVGSARFLPAPKPSPGSRR